MCYCGGVMGIVLDDLGCEFMVCSNYAVCDHAYYTAAQSDAHFKAYRAARALKAVAPTPFLVLEIDNVLADEGI